MSARCKHCDDTGMFTRMGDGARFICECCAKSKDKTMNARERYYLNSHLHRLMLWQIRMLEEETAKLRAERRERLRILRRAYKDWRLGITYVRKANVEFYNRQIARGF